jgi:hypothetical protein
MGFESHELRSLTRFCIIAKSKICLFMRINTKSPRYCSANRKDIIPQLLILFRKSGIIDTESLAVATLWALRGCVIDDFAKMPLQASIFASWYNRHINTQ